VCDPEIEKIKQQIKDELQPLKDNQVKISADFRAEIKRVKKNV